MKTFEERSQTLLLLCWFWSCHIMLPAESSRKTKQSGVTAALARIAVPGQSRPGCTNGSRSNNWRKRLPLKPGNFSLLYYNRGIYSGFLPHYTEYFKH